MKDGGFVPDEEKKAKVLPVLEISTFTLDKSASEVLKELGYADPEELRKLRAAEDLFEDPRVQQAMTDFLGPSHGMEVAQKQINWIAAEMRYKSFIQKFNEVKDEYFKLDQERQKLFKECSEAQTDFISALRKQYIDEA